MSSPAESMIEVEDVAKGALGFERIHILRASSFRDNSTVVMVPTRGMIHHKVVAAWKCMLAPMNQKQMFIMCQGAEVGQAYNAMVQNVLETPEVKDWKYILTLEDDNLPPPDAHIRLLETIAEGYDAVSGLYFTKGDYNMPMAYGNAEYYRKTGEMGFEPQSVSEMINAGRVLEVNGIGMGCALWRIDLFREVPPPWFITLSDMTPDHAASVMTQDLFFCKRARLVGKRFAVDCRVKVGHMDVNTGVVY